VAGTGSSARTKISAVADVGVVRMTRNLHANPGDDVGCLL
jgi:hypothetical protein